MCCACRKPNARTTHFRSSGFTRLGYEHAALNGQKGYHGVAVLSRLPFESIDIRNFCGKTDCRHVSVAFGAGAGLHGSRDGA